MDKLKDGYCLLCASQLACCPKCDQESYKTMCVARCAHPLCSYQSFECCAHENGMLETERNGWLCAIHSHVVVVNCDVCYRRELESSHLTARELRVFLATAENCDRKLSRNIAQDYGENVTYKCERCSQYLHLQCRDFYLTCDACYHTQEMCTHVNRYRPYCASCCIDDRKTRCATCGDGTELVPFKDSGFACVHCHSKFHKKCKTLVVVDDQISCVSCATETKEQEAEVASRNIARRTQRRDMALALAEKTNLCVLERIGEFAYNTMTIEELQSQLENDTLYRHYCPWTDYSNKTRRELRAVRDAGYHTATHHSEADVKWALDLQMARIIDLNRKPWEVAMPVSDWRNLVGF